MIVKLSLVAAFVMTMATLTLAASALPPEGDVIAAQTTVASAATVRTGSARTVAMPSGVVPTVAVELMASL